MTHQATYVVCLDSAGYLASLEPRKIYRQLPDRRAEQDGLVRIIDESGDDYLYPARLFAPIDVPEAVERAFSSVA